MFFAFYIKQKFYKKTFVLKAFGSQVMRCELYNLTLERLFIRHSLFVLKFYVCVYQLLNCLFVIIYIVISFSTSVVIIYLCMFLVRKKNSFDLFINLDIVISLSTLLTLNIPYIEKNLYKSFRTIIKAYLMIFKSNSTSTKKIILFQPTNYC